MSTVTFYPTNPAPDQNCWIVYANRENTEYAYGPGSGLDALDAALSEAEAAGMTQINVAWYVCGDPVPANPNPPQPAPAPQPQPPSNGGGGESGGGQAGGYDEISILIETIVEQTTLIVSQIKECCGEIKGGPGPQPPSGFTEKCCLEITAALSAIAAAIAKITLVVQPGAPETPLNWTPLLESLQSLLGCVCPLLTRIANTLDTPIEVAVPPIPPPPPVPPPPGDQLNNAWSLIDRAKQIVLTMSPGTQ